MASAWAQYPGHIDTSKKQENVPRAVAVLEWSGDIQKPTAARLIPISLFYQGAFEDAGIYLAHPEPLALESGTEYELEHAGQPSGFFDVNSAARASDGWVGVGTYKAPETKKAQAAGKQVDEDRPHFHKSASSAGSAGADASRGSASGGDTAATSADSVGKTDDKPVDNDRPTLRRRTPGSTAASAPSAEGEGNLAAPQLDKDRPRIRRGKSASAEEEDHLPQLKGIPLDMKQTVAVSDSRNREPHPFAYTFANAQERIAAQNKMILLAQQLLQSGGAASSKVAGAAAKVPAPSTSRRPVGATRRPVSHAQPTGPLPQLMDVSFNAFALTYENVPVFVLTAKTTDDPPAQKMITVVAEQDIYGEPQVVLKNITDANHLEDRPDMRLVDAVDADASNRASLLFELRGVSGRQFALYRVTRGTATAEFSSAEMP